MKNVAAWVVIGGALAPFVVVPNELRMALRDHGVGALIRAWIAYAIPMTAFIAMAFWLSGLTGLID